MRLCAPRLHFGLLLCLLAGAPVAAQDLSWSGFGTLGVSKSNRDFTYQRYITRDGGLNRDSLMGLQADLRLNPQWSATLQLKAAPSLKADSRWDVVPTWAFVAWRPNDDWLLRAGRLRLPLYLYSESMDVGQTHDMARLPTELYSVAPSSDFDGVYITRTWQQGDAGERDISVDAYHGTASTTARSWTRDGAPPAVPAGPVFHDVKVQASGVALTLRQPGLVLRGSLHGTRTRRAGGQPLPVTFAFVPLPVPGLGYYQVSNSLPGPCVASVPAIQNTVLSLGGEYSFGSGWRLAGEYVRNQQHDTELASDTTAAYLALFRRFGQLTPYVSVSRLGSRQVALDWYHRLTNNTLPAFIPGAAQINAAQRLAAESIWLADQQSLALGASYALTPQLKLKGEWLRSQIGQASRLVDTPPGSPAPHNTTVDVLSVNLNFAF